MLATGSAGGCLLGGAVHGWRRLAGAPVHVIADRLGHADPSITLQVHARVIRQHPAGIADVFAAAVDQLDNDQVDEDDDPDASALTPCWQFRPQTERNPRSSTW